MLLNASGLRGQWLLPVTILTLTLSALVSTSDDSLATVTTTKGKLRGTGELSRIGRAYFSFRGVRYAQPPKRFEEAKPVGSWEDVKAATALGESCPQQFGTSAPIGGKEDCLFLNVYTSTLDKEAGLNVMVWIHGGGFQFGSSSEYDPDYFMDHDVVLVTINYRLGILGFLSSGDEALPGNLGLKDQRLALQWVRDNIKEFGGASDKVTIFGESAGAAAVNFHVLSPSSQGLFHSAIALSGSALNPWALQTKPKDNFELLLKKAGCPASPREGLKCLGKLGADKIIELQNSFMEWFIFPLTTFAPVVEPLTSSAMITDSPSKAMAKGSFNRVPYLTGVTAHEGLSFTAPLIFNEDFRKDMDSEPSRVFPIALIYKETGNLTQKLVDFYMGRDHTGFIVENWSGLEKWFGDRWINHGVVEATRLLSQHTPVYNYIFSYQGEASSMKTFWGVPDVYGVAHGDDLQYLFKSWSGLPPVAGVESPSERVSEELVQCLVDFARNGRPRGWGRERVWKAAEGEGKWKWYGIDEETKSEDLEESILPRLHFWNSVYPEHVGGSRWTDEL